MSQWSPVAARSERWKREDSAPRLAVEVPPLTSLRLELTEHFNGRTVMDSRRVRHIIVERGAALFEVPCSDARCDDGGHDITRDVLAKLKAFRTSFVGQDRCSGYVGDRPCGRVLEFTGHAEFDMAKVSPNGNGNRTSVTD